MRRTNEFGIGMTVVGIFCAATAVVLGLELASERKEAKRKADIYNADLDKAVENITDEIAKRTHDEIVSKAIEKAADRMVSDILNKASNKAVENTKSMMGTEISRRVSSEWDIAKGTIRDKILKKVDRCDISELKDKAVEEAQDKLLDDLSDKLDDLADRVNSKYEAKADKLLDAYEKRLKEKLQYPYSLFF